MTLPDTAIVPCGGIGTRMRPVSRWVPKELLPVALVPLLHWTLREAAEAGLRRAVVVASPHKPLLAQAAREWDGPLEIELVPQETPRGLGDALLRSRPALAGAPAAVLLPDNLFLDGNPTAEVLAVHRATGLATVLLAEIARDAAAEAGPTGRARVESAADGTLRVTAVAGKQGARFDTGGAAAALTPIGRMVLPPDAFDALAALDRTLPVGAELDDVPVLQQLAVAGRLAGARSAARFFDVGIPEGYRAAVAAAPARL